MTAPGAEPPTSADPVDDGFGWDNPLTRLLLLLEIADQPDWLRDLVAPAGTAGGVSSPSHSLG
ncbi:hypothetical protein ACH4LN_03970 [Streptomyces albus]|uniref:hypothetical protein n=1 Tax=Streptomyces TaxID=1883 RepID=UPI00034E02B0|nr:MULTISPECIES: hypothetical protein [Streptomyces]KPC95095.1 hypothetical protein ADL27_09915 [Streptomyces sp. NRRL F-6602]EPD93014.1 hypothetical protein HMPREF1486_04091 [Streptomyces sp. HPH0547]MDI6409007.1 hypothetical protein [Streptomyces albus]UVN53848.1 hypothetical protein NR995_04365 [Streptomyces albus]GHJ18790.1 hypothetical protein TPA0909_04040 [Streptomyces albus]